jgi:hypothetical protein
MQRSCSRLSAIAVSVAAGLVVAACGGSNSSSSSTAAVRGASPSRPATITYTSGRATVIGKSTAVVVNPLVSAAFKHAGITVHAVAPATAKTTLRFPVSSGQIVIATLIGTIYHTGGLTFRHSGNRVTLTNFVINTKTKQLTATVSGRSIPIFNLQLTWYKRARGPRGTIIARNIKLTVTSQAATALNSDLGGVSTFKSGMNFGIATSTVAYARGHR